MKKVMVALVAGAMITALAACEKGNATGSRMGNNNAVNASASAVTTYTDVSVVQEIFPELEGIESVEYEVIKHGGDDPRSVPGPTDYVYQGYIVLTEEAANTIAASYEWQDYDTDISFEAVTERSGDYKLDGHFTQDILKKTYSGKVWFNEADKTILFRAGTM